MIKKKKSLSGCWKCGQDCGFNRWTRCIARTKKALEHFSPVEWLLWKWFEQLAFREKRGLANTWWEIISTLADSQCQFQFQFNHCPHWMGRGRFSIHYGGGGVSSKRRFRERNRKWKPDWRCKMKRKAEAEGALNMSEKGGVKEKWTDWQIRQEVHQERRETNPYLKMSPSSSKTWSMTLLLHLSMQSPTHHLSYSTSSLLSQTHL